MLCTCVAYALAFSLASGTSHNDSKSAYRSGGAIVALGMEGGGFRALTCQTGLIAGLLAATSKQSHDWLPSLAGSGLLKRFSIISSVSGGSWFSSELIFSNQFVSLVEGMAGSPKTAAAQFAARWTKPWLTATGVDPARFNLLKVIAEEICALILGTSDEETIFLLAFFLSTGFSWNHFVDVLLNSTGSIGQDVLLGSPVATWAESKIWLVDHTVVVPTKGKQALVYYADAEVQVRYVGDSATLPWFLPAKFSINLGEGPASSAPVEYMASSALIEADMLNYTGDESGRVYRARSPPLGQDASQGNLMKFAGMLPVTRVTAASSAFLGAASILGALVGEFQTFINGDLTPWVSAAPNGKAFSVANKQVQGFSKAGGINQQTISNSASVAVHGVIDGGESDNTGIANAVAAGADEVLVILNGNSTQDPMALKALFRGTWVSPDPFVPQALFPVFSSPSSEAVQDLLSKFHVLTLPDGTHFLKYIAVGTFTATTATNKFFGVQSGRSVKIHVVSIGSDLTIGYFENFSNYNLLAQEIIITILDEANSAFVGDSFLPMFLGSKASAADEMRSFV